MQEETRIISVLIFGAPDIRDFTVVFTIVYSIEWATDNTLI